MAAMTRIKRLLVYSVVLSIGIYLSLILLAGVISRAIIIEALTTWLPTRPLHGITVLVFGTDDTKTSQRADAIMVVHIDNDRTGVISIPRDTRVHIDGVGVSKINHAYAYGGTDLLKKTVSEFLHIPIHHHIQVNTGQLAEAINYIGGI